MPIFVEAVDFSDLNSSPRPRAPSLPPLSIAEISSATYQRVALAINDEPWDAAARILRELLDNPQLRKLAAQTLREIREAGGELERAYAVVSAENNHTRLICDLWALYTIEGVRIDASRLKAREDLDYLLDQIIALGDEAWAPATWVERVASVAGDVDIELAQSGGRWRRVIRRIKGVDLVLVEEPGNAEFEKLFAEIVRDDWRKRLPGLLSLGG
jgi:hypothetical protein